MEKHKKKLRKGKDGRYYVGNTPIEKVKDSWKYLPVLPDTIDFYN
jgi:hypothetical protein